MSSKILVVGGSFGGLGFVKHFISQFSSFKPNYVNVEIFLIDPRAGFLNVLAIPQTVIDVPFAKASYIPLESYNLRFDSVESTNKELVERVKNAVVDEPAPSNLKLHFLHGKCLKFIDEKTINYKLNGDDTIKDLKFDYAIYSAGRARPWPFDPRAETQGQFLDEVREFKPQVEKAQKITVVGGGALGIEVAGAIKQLYSNKDVTLIHPHPFLPPEALAVNELRSEVTEGIKKQGIDVELSTRVKEELPSGDLLTTDGRTIQSDLALWCNYHKNNIDPLLPIFKDALEPKTENVNIETNFLIKGSKNVFAVGDIVNLPIFKLAGGAHHNGIKIANSLYNIIVEGKEEYNRIDLAAWSDHITIVVGTKFAVAQKGDGSVVVNEPQHLAMYQDYRNNFIMGNHEFHLDPNFGGPTPAIRGGKVSGRGGRGESKA